MVRSHALYPIELRAQFADLRLGIIAETNLFSRLPSPKLFNLISRRRHRTFCRYRTARVKTLCFGAVYHVSVCNQMLSRNTLKPQDLYSGKSFHRNAKPTSADSRATLFCNTLEMASDMLIYGADEVARNGAFGKILRPEVFSDAPLQKLRFVAPKKSHSAQFPDGPPPKVLLKHKKLSGVLPFPISSR
jgi:hypothetical protein